MRLEHVDSLLRASHITSLGDEFAPCLDQRLRLILRDFVLRRGWKCHIYALNVLPWSLALHILEFSFVTVGILQLCQLLSLDLEISNVGHIIWADTLVAGRNYCALAVGERDDRCPKLDGFERRVLGDVSRT